jgi:hypothetical protein
MADEKDKEAKSKDKDRPPTVAPEPASVELFEFIVKHFSNGSMPQLIELRQAFGPGGRHYAENAIDSWEFRLNQPVPSHTELIEMTNKILALAQRDCDELGKATGYGILFKNHVKSDKYYGVFYKKLSPKSRYIDSESGEADGDDVIPDAKRRDSLLAFSLEHMRESDLNERWRSEQFAKSTGGILEHYQQLAAMLMKQNLELMHEHREMVKQTDDALSHKIERELAAKKEEFRMQMLGDGFNFLKGMLPVAVNQITGKQTIPTDKSNESIAVQSFLDGLSKAQAEQLFGHFDEGGGLKGDGIFSSEQTQIFAGVAQCRVPPAALDQLIEGAHAVTEAQTAQAMTVLSQQQVMPLLALIMSLKKKQMDGGGSSS